MSQTEKPRQWTPLHQAARSGDQDMVRLLLEFGADLTARDPGGATPLHHAAYFGHPQVAQELLASGADPEAKDGAGYRPIDWAREHKHTEMMRLLELVETLSE